MLKYFLFYFFAINIITLLICLYDKQCAIKNRWRISEKSLILLSIIGGSVGMYCGMHLFRHKTKHAKFTVGVPVILVVQLILCYLVINNFILK